MEQELAVPRLDHSDSLSSPALKSTTSESHSESWSDCPSEESGLRTGRKRGVGRPTEKPTEFMKKKGEEMDKYWLRSFRAYMKENYAFLRGRLTRSQETFWDHYMSKEGEPGKTTPFHSYSRKYRDSLFTEYSFRRQFELWFSKFGEENLSKKYPYQSPMWELFYSHAIDQYFGRDPSPVRIIDDPNWVDREEMNFIREFDEDFYIASP